MSGLDSPAASESPRTPIPDHIPESRKATLSERVGFIVFAIIFGLICTLIFLDPELVSIDTSEMDGRKGRGIGNIINLLWSRPVGGILGLISLVLTWNAISGKVNLDEDERRALAEQAAAE